MIYTDSGRRQASREELLRLFQATESLYYDGTPLFRSDYADLRERYADISIEPLDQKKIDGNMRRMLEDAMRFLKIHLASPHSIKELQPEVRPEFPGCCR